MLYLNAWVICGEWILSLENIDQVAISTALCRRMARYCPVVSKETCVGVDDNDNSLPAIGGGIF
jgi:hypothetical protein